MKIGIVVPHIFMHRDILPQVIFSPATLALQLAEGLQQLGATITLFSPGLVDTTVKNITADLHYFEQELAARGDSYTDLLKKHPLTFITLARQVQAELIAKAFAMANDGELDVVHIYTNEEDTALPFAALCQRPVVFTHHDPFNFLVKYKNLFPKYKQLNWISLSYAQRRSMPADTNWIANIYHGLPETTFHLQAQPAASTDRYIAYLGRIIEPKGVHLAIAAVKAYNAIHPDMPYRLRIAGRHYAGTKDSYWQERIKPALQDPYITYAGFMRTAAEKQTFLGGASALMVPSTFAEPFGMVMIEALACGTPVIGLASGAIPEVIAHSQTGFVVPRSDSDEQTAAGLVAAIDNISTINRTQCRQEFSRRFTAARMCAEHLDAYKKLTTVE